MMPNGIGGSQPPYARLPQQGYVQMSQQQLQQQLQLQQQQQQRIMMMQQQQRFTPQPAAIYNRPVAAGFIPVQAAIPQQMARVRPPQYSTQMQQDFRQKKDHLQKQHQYLEAQKKQAEQAEKQRQFQEQQKRLKEFSAHGGRKMDADRLIESIIGPSRTTPRPGTSATPSTSAESLTIQKRGLVHQCRLCLEDKYRFRGDKSELEQHILINHCPEDEVPFLCSICKRRHVVLKALMDHLGKCHPGEGPASIKGTFKTFTLKTSDYSVLDMVASQQHYNSRPRTDSLSSDATEDLVMDTDSEAGSEALHGRKRSAENGESPVCKKSALDQIKAINDEEEESESKEKPSDTEEADKDTEKDTEKEANTDVQEEAKEEGDEAASTKGTEEEMLTEDLPENKSKEEDSDKDDSKSSCSVKPEVATKSSSQSGEEDKTVDNPVPSTSSATDPVKLKTEPITPKPSKKEPITVEISSGSLPTESQTVQRSALMSPIVRSQSRDGQGLPGQLVSALAPLQAGLLVLGHQIEGVTDRLADTSAVSTLTRTMDNMTAAVLGLRSDVSSFTVAMKGFTDVIQGLEPMLERQMTSLLNQAVNRENLTQKVQTSSKELSSESQMETEESVRENTVESQAAETSDTNTQQESSLTCEQTENVPSNTEDENSSKESPVEEALQVNTDLPQTEIDDTDSRSPSITTRRSLRANRRDDNFGDFMSGPVGSVPTAAPTDVMMPGGMQPNQQIPQQMVPNQPIPQQGGPNQPIQQPGVPNQPIAQLGVPNQPVQGQPMTTDVGSTPIVTDDSPDVVQMENASKQEKKDLMAMMMQCSDLTAPQKAKGFIKPSVKEVQPLRKTTVTFSESKQSRHWGATDNNLSELFTQPVPEPQPDPSQTMPTSQPIGPPGVAAPPPPQPIGAGGPPPVGPVPPSQPFTMPRWATGEIPVPAVYRQVLEAVTVEDKISTERLYPLLMRSNLPREGLGYLWGLCNKATPGQLITPELYLLLAMISVAQNNLNCSSLDILTRCPQPPIPNLGQNTNVSNPGVQGATNVTAGSQGVANVTALPPSDSTATVPQAVPAAAMPPDAAEDDFADFQSAPVPPQPASSGFADISAAAPNNTSTPVAISGVIPDSIPVRGHRLSKSEKKYAAFGHMHDHDEEDDIDAYFNGNKEVSPLPKSDPTDPFKRNPRLPSPKKSMETDFPMGDTEITTTVKSEMPDFDTFGSFAAGHSESSSSQSQGWTSSTNSNLTTESSNTDDFADFASASDIQTDDFTDFMQAKSDTAIDTIAEKPSDSVDKYSALKALVQDKSLFEDKSTVFEVPPAIEVEKPTNDEKPAEEDEWAEFASRVVNPSDVEKSAIDPSAGSQLDWPAVGGLSTQSSGTSLSGMTIGMTDFPKAASSASLTETTSQDSNWAAFGSAPATQPESLKKVESEPQLKVDSSKANKLFANNLGTQSVGFGAYSMSAYDMVPPEIPDIKDEEDEFDAFGTFQTGNGREGISSLAGGLEDFGDFAMPKSAFSSTTTQNFMPPPTLAAKDTADTISMSSMEFSGWKNPAQQSKEDTQSMNSLELKNVAKEESPSGVDSQSVSSLDFTAADRKSNTPDGRSVSSLELKATDAASEDITDKPSAAPEEFGQFNTAPVTTPGTQANQWPANNEVQKPRDVSELMTKGDLLTVGDRYSGLIQEPQDTDRHAHLWQRCLEKAKKLLLIAMDAFQSTSNSEVCREIVNSEKGANFVNGIVEVYRVTCKIKQAMRAATVSNNKLASLVQEIEDTWANMTIFLTNTQLMPEKASLDCSKAVLKSADMDSQQKACGVCLLNVDVKCRLSPADNSHKLTYGAKQYHAACANFWVNCVDSTLPALNIPELL